MRAAVEARLANALKCANKRVARRSSAWILLNGAATTLSFLCFMALVGTASPQVNAGNAAAPPATVRVDATPGHAINSFDPDSALGSSIDVLSRTDINKVYTPHIVQEALSAGWGPITYRNNTELRMAVWHWTEDGTWSDAAHRSGYFTGSTELKRTTRYILAYALPHRGFATSGDRPIQGPDLSYWKSNPYLTNKFTGESDTLHPQWVVMDLKGEKPVSAVRVAWANPYATTYQIEYWTGTNALDFDGGPKGEWKLFSSGAFKNAQGSTVAVKLTDTPVSTRYLRILMTESSNTCDEHGSDDVRNCVGYAIQQIVAGRLDASGAFVEVAKDAGERRTTYCVSSIDPWHSEDDVDDGGGYQHRLPTLRSAATPSATSRWERNPMASMPCRRTMPHFICSGPRPFTRLTLS
jgi:hypothetical protein